MLGHLEEMFLFQYSEILLNIYAISAYHIYPNVGQLFPNSSFVKWCITLLPPQNELYMK
jgi:hypothetical protein